VIRVGDVISIDGNTGEVFLGEMRSLPADLTPHYVTLLDWADRARTLEVWAECKTTPDALQSKLFGADGMNLLYDPTTLLPRGGGSVPNDSAPVDERSAYKAALAKFSLAYKDLVGEVLAVASGTPVAIRLIDATLGEFVWQLESGSAILRKRGPRPIPTAIDVPEAAGASIEDLNQFQLAITHEEIHQLQCRSIFDAAAEVSKAGIHVTIRIIIPFVLNEIEFNVIRSKILNLKNKICEDAGGDFTCHIGAGIDLPCAAFASGEIAKNAALLVFDSDHLTRATHGLPHADLDGLFVRYLELGLISQDPFISLDRRSVGQLLALACELAKNSQPGIKIGLSGRQGSDPPSVQICHELGFSYVSCPPAHVPAIRIAAAQAALQ
jgi:pyruvate,orthophosphate dikinase